MSRGEHTAVDDEFVDFMMLLSKYVRDGRYVINRDHDIVKTMIFTKCQKRCCVYNLLHLKQLVTTLTVHLLLLHDPPCSRTCSLRDTKSILHCQARFPFKRNRLRLNGNRALTCYRPLFDV